MSKHGRRGVVPAELDTPERGLTLDTREAPPLAPLRGPAGDLAELRERIDGAGLAQAPEACPCRNCWTTGFRAVLTAMRAGSPQDDPAEELLRLRELLEGARGLDAKGLHWRDWWLAGRDAAIAMIDGEDG